MLIHRISALAFVLLSLSGSVALADYNTPMSPQPGMQKPAAGNHRHHRMMMMQQLNLSQEQKQKMEEIRNKYKEQISENQQSLRQSEKQLRDMMTGTATEDQIRSKYEEVQTLRQKLGNMRFESMLAMRNILTSEQRQKMSEMMKKHHQNMHG